MVLAVNHLADWGKTGHLSPKKNPYRDIFVPEDSLGDKELTLRFRVGRAKVSLHLLGFNSCLRKFFSERERHR